MASTPFKAFIDIASGELEIEPEGSGGSGSGTVTSVAGGFTITNTPDPITGAGSVNLDINKQAAVTTVNAGDLFILVDTAISTAPSSARKITFANLVAAIGSGNIDIKEDGSVVVASATALNFNEPDAVLVTASGSQANVDMTMYLLRSGRPDQTNDAIINNGTFTGPTTGLGVGNLYGTTIIGGQFPPTGELFVGLGLNASTSPDAQFTAILLNPHITSITGFAIMCGFASSVTINDIGPPFSAGAAFTGFGTGNIGPFSSTWTIGDDSQGGMSADFFSWAPIITNPTGVPKHLARVVTVFVDNGQFVADGAACDIAHYRGYHFQPQFSTTNGGTLALTGVGDALVGFHSDVTFADGGVSCPTLIAFRHSVNINSDPSAALVDDIALQVDVVHPTSPGSTGLFLTIYSPDKFRQSRHVGAFVIGADAPPTGAFILEAIGDVHISGKLTLDGALDPTDILYSGQLTSTIATGTAPMVIASTTAVANLNADMVDGLHASDLAKKLPPILLPAQGADIADTSITGTAGDYRVQVYIIDAASDISAGAVTVNIKFNDGTGAQTVSVGPIALTGVGTVSASKIIPVRLASGNLTYGTTHTGAFGTATYTLDVITEQLA